MKKTILSFAILAIILTSCKNNREKLIVKKWKTVDVDYLSMNKAHEQYRAVMDTMTEKNEMLLDFKTIDSSKKFLQFLIESDLEQKKESIATTFLELKSNNKAYFTSIDGVDSSAWHIEDDELVLEDGDVTDITNTTRMHIVKLTQDDFELRSIMGSDTSYIKMKPYKE